MRIRFRPSALALLAALPMTACEQTTTEPGMPDLRPAAFAITTEPNPLGEEIVVCKVGPAGSYDFTYTGTNFRTQPNTAIAGSFSLAAGDCRSVGFFGGAGVSIDITETVPAGHEVVSIAVDQLTSADQNIAGPTNTVTGVLASGNPKDAALVTFTNRLLPPPPGGGEGCTPGYWKQKQHFDSYPAGYTSDMLFLDAFGVDAFPGMTLVEVAAQGGGGLKALGRHAVAALLNAASGGVDYDLTVAEVIGGFTSAYNSGDYNAQKDIFESFNEQGCPLN